MGPLRLRPFPKHGQMALVLSILSEEGSCSWWEQRLSENPEHLLLMHGGPLPGINWAFDDPAEAWEVLEARGATPEGWASRPERTFGLEFERRTCSACLGGGWAPSVLNARTGRREFTGNPCGVCSGSGTRTSVFEPTFHPATLTRCALIAADVPGILAAEAIGWSAARVLNAKADRIVWSYRKGLWFSMMSKWKWERVHGMNLGEPLYHSGYGFEEIDDSKICMLYPGFEQ